MSELVSTPPKTKSPRSGAEDKAALAQVEKWLAIIREVARDEAKS